MLTLEFCNCLNYYRNLNFVLWIIHCKHLYADGQFWDYIVIKIAFCQVSDLSKGDVLALSYTIQAAKFLDHIFLEQVILVFPVKLTSLCQ